MPTPKERDAMLLQAMIRMDPRFNQLPESHQGAVDTFLSRALDPNRSVLGVHQQSRGKISKTDAKIFDKLAPEVNPILKEANIQFIPEAQETASNRILELEGIRRSRPDRPDAPTAQERIDQKLDRVIRSGDIGRQSDPKRRAEMQKAKVAAEEQGVPLTERFMAELRGEKIPEAPLPQAPREVSGIAPGEEFQKVTPLLAVQVPEELKDNPELLSLMEQTPVSENIIGSELDPNVVSTLVGVPEVTQSLGTPMAEMEATQDVLAPAPEAAPPVPDPEPIEVTSTPDMDADLDMNLGGGGGGLGGFLGGLFGF